MYLWLTTRYHKCYLRVQRVLVQSLLTGSESDITSAHVHKPEANFHSRAKGNLTTGKVKEKLHHTVHIRRCLVHKPRTPRRKRMTKKSTGKLAKQPFSWTPWNTLKGRQLREMEQKSTRRNNGECRIQSIWYLSCLEMWLLSFSNSCKHRWSSQSSA